MLELQGGKFAIALAHAWEIAKAETAIRTRYVFSTCQGGSDTYAVQCITVAVIVMHNAA